jgi:hypothetical protein
MVKGVGFRVQGSGFRVQGSGFRVQGSELRIQGLGIGVCRGTSLIRTYLPIGLYSRTMPRALWWF